MKAIAGIDPYTKRCELIAIDRPEHRQECEKEGLMIVPTTIEKAREILYQVVDDIYSLVPQPQEGRE